MLAPRILKGLDKEWTQFFEAVKIFHMLQFRNVLSRIELSVSTLNSKL